MSEPILPSEEYLRALQSWPFAAWRDLPAAMAAGWYRGRGRADEVHDGLWLFVTGGWEGNESILCSAMRSVAWYILGWRALILPGGVCICAVSDEAQMRLARVYEYITTQLKTVG